MINCAEGYKVSKTSSENGLLDLATRLSLVTSTGTVWVKCKSRGRFRSFKCK